MFRFGKMKQSILNKIFDKVVCINLVERADRKEGIKSQLKKNNIDFEFYHPVKLGFSNIIAEHVTLPVNPNSRGYFNISQPNEVGCAISHYSVIKQAYLEGVKNLFIFEDDIMLDNDFNNKFDIYYKLLPENWNMILLYSFIRVWEDRMIPVNKHWRQAHNNWSCVAYGMNRKFMEEYINAVDKYFCIADLTTLKLQEKLNCYVCDPFIVQPNLMESDIRMIRR